MKTRCVVDLGRGETAGPGRGWPDDELLSVCAAARGAGIGQAVLHHVRPGGGHGPTSQVAHGRDLQHFPQAMVQGARKR